MKTIEQLRSETPGCKHRIHLNNAGASLPPAAVLAAIQNHLSLEAETGGYEASDQMAEAIEGFYSSLARLLNTSPQNIAFASNATDAYARALSAIPWKSGDVILTTDNDYVSNQIAFLSLQKRFQIQLLRAAEQPEGGVDLNDMERLIRLHRPKVVAVTHVPTNSGLVQPVEAIGRICRELDLLYLVDACQSAGQIQLDVERIGCDFLSATLRKFLRGPRGAGFLFVSDRVLNAGLEMLLPDMRSATWTGANTYTPAPDARRFEYWETAPALMLGGKAAVDYALNVGLSWIENRIGQLAGFTRERLAKVPGVQILDKGPRLCGIVTAHHPKWDTRALLDFLSARGINARVSPLYVAQIDFPKKGVEWALRLSPHYYNTEAELEAAVAAIAEFQA